jgi:hypothetical protein
LQSQREVTLARVRQKSLQNRAGAADNALSHDVRADSGRCIGAPEIPP